MKKTWLFILAAMMLVSGLCGCGKREKVIASLSDAGEARIGVVVGTVGEIIAHKRFPNARIETFDEIMDSVAAMKAGKLDAVITPYPGTLNFIKENPEFHTLPEPLEEVDTSIAVKKGNDKLLAELDEVITQLKNDGTLADLKQRWFKTDLSPVEEKNLATPREGKVLRIGVTTTREPFTFADSNGRVTGHDIELARIIANRLHRSALFSDMKFMALVPALQAGKIDIIVTGMTTTSERRKFVNFTQPYFANALVMLVKKGGGTNKKVTGLASPDDLKYKRIGVLLGSTYDGYATRTYPNATILQYKTISDIVLAVKSGKIDAAIYSYDELVELFRHHNDLGFLGKSLFLTPVAMGFHPRNDELRTAFNQFLKQIRENGQNGEMVRRWMEDGDTRMPDIKPAPAGSTLTVGLVSDNGLPFTVVQDNRLVGYNIELLERFAAHLGKRITYVDMEFGSLIAAVAGGKIDMIGAVMAITEERKKRIAFSDPYYEAGAYVFALKKNIAGQGNAAETMQSARFSSFLAGMANSFQSNIIHEKRYSLILAGLKTTVVIALWANIFGALLGALVCFMRMSKKSMFQLPAKVYIAILRGTPVLVVLMLIYYVVFASIEIDPVLVAIIAFGMNFAAYVAEIFRTGIEGIDKGQTEAGTAMGFTRVKTFIYIVLPQTVRRILPVYKGEFISLVKMTSVVGYIAVQDLTKASDIIRSRTFDAFFPLVMVAILYFLISWLLLQSLGYVERRTDPKFKRRKASNT